MDTILSEFGDATQTPRKIIQSYLHDVITEQSVVSIPPCMRQPRLDGLWDQITPEKMKAAKLDMSIASEIDGLMPRKLRALPVNVLVRILNLIM